MSNTTANKVKALIDQGENQLFQHAGMFHDDLLKVAVVYYNLFIEDLIDHINRVGILFYSKLT